MNDVFALKYRPKKIADMIGQEQAVRFLTNTINGAAAGRQPHHAYIFAGKFGCGKTSAARIFAASMNNPKGVSLEPDMDNPLVQSIFRGEHIDTQEFDAGALGKVDEIRSIRENIRFSPLESRYRFVILDESHRLTEAAADAALKMIEEPPPDTIFVLATTDPERLKSTIHSRCQTVRFNSVSWDCIYRNLKSIAEQEKINIDEAALRMAAKRSKGSVRNSLQNLWMLKTFAGSEAITGDVAAKALASVEEGRYFDLVDSILKSDTSEAMRSIDLMLGDGREVGDVLDGLVDHLRNLLIITSCSSTAGLICITEDEKKRFANQVSRFPQGTKGVALVAQMIDLLADVRKAVYLNMNPQTMLESFAVKAVIYSAGLKRAEA